MTYKQTRRLFLSFAILSLVGCVEKPSSYDPGKDDGTTTADMPSDMTPPAEMGSDMPSDMPSDMTVDMTATDMPADMSIDMPVDMGPCGGTCMGEQVCEETTGTCVDCLSDSQCDDPTPVCDTTNNICVGCLNEGNCGGDEPVCKQEGQTCVQCVDDTTCNNDTPRCDEPNNVCVGCLENADCLSADASLCGENKQCGSCLADDDCKHLDLNRCIGDICLECTPETEEQDCGNAACLPDGTCGTTPRKTLTTCQPCQADSECLADYRCVPMDFGDPAMPHGNFCLKIASAGCSRPYTVGISRESISGAASEEYCGINQEKTTCQALQDLQQGDKACLMDAECGAPGLDDAICGTTIAGKVCTITCGNNSQCTDGQTCGATEKYCK